jgi:hypothetical protein
VRDSSDCHYIAAAVITNEQTTLALLFGLLAGAYLNHPDALFWDVCVKFLEKRPTGEIVRVR